MNTFSSRAFSLPESKGLNPPKAKRNRKAASRPPLPELRRIESAGASPLNHSLEDEVLYFINAGCPNCLPARSSRSLDSFTNLMGSVKRSYDYDAVNAQPWAGLLPPGAGQRPHGAGQRPHGAGQRPHGAGQRPLGARTLPLGARPLPRIKVRDDLFVKEHNPPQPPPPLPKKGTRRTTSYGIAVRQFDAKSPNHLPLQEYDLVILLRYINDDWIYGRVKKREGRFPLNCIKVHVPLPKSEDDRVVTASCKFVPHVGEDLALKPGKKVRVLERVSDYWLKGESEGMVGIFPAYCVDRIPFTFK